MVRVHTAVPRKSIAWLAVPLCRTFCFAANRIGKRRGDGIRPPAISGWKVYTSTGGEAPRPDDGGGRPRDGPRGMLAYRAAVPFARAPGAACPNRAPVPDATRISNTRSGKVSLAAIVQGVTITRSNSNRTPPASRSACSPPNRTP